MAAFRRKAGRHEFFRQTETVEINAWSGAGPVSGPNIDPENNWGLRSRIFTPRPSARVLLPAAPPNERDWLNPRVGWGLVLLDDPKLSNKDLAAGEDVPKPLKDLVAARKGIILRYAPSSTYGFFRRYFADGSEPSDLDISASGVGTGEEEIPKYLLIWGSPKAIPWRTQYAMNMSRCVGRLDLDEEQLKNYVGHLLGNWVDAACNPLLPVIWSVNYGGGDITALMQRVVADALWQKFQGDADFVQTAVRLKDAGATRDALAEALAARPGLVVTTSHGMTRPQEGTGSYAAQLGAPVDANHALLTSEWLSAAAIPSGAIWYSHACCSAGSDSQSQCADLFPPGNSVGDALRGVSSNAGQMVSPLARRLLGAEKPVRAFVGTCRADVRLDSARPQYLSSRQHFLRSGAL